jgi:hypothetical protein
METISLTNAAQRIDKCGGPDNSYLINHKFDLTPVGKLAYGSAINRVPLLTAVEV